MFAEVAPFEQRRPHHIGLVVRDIERAIAHLEGLGFGPFRFDDEQRVGTVQFSGELRGRHAQWAIKVSNAGLGEIELELLEPSAGDQALRETLDAQGEGLHHIGWLTNDLAGDVERATVRGAKVWTRSAVPGQPNFVYFEPSEVGGLVVELREP